MEFVQSFLNDSEHSIIHEILTNYFRFMTTANNKLLLNKTKLKLYFDDETFNY